MRRALHAWSHFARLGFAAFVGLHLGLEALRAATDGPIPSAGFEGEPAVVALVTLGLFLPFGADALRKLGERPAPGALGEDGARALALLDWLASAVVLAFTAWHWVRLALPLLSGSFERADLRPELVASLSGTSWGLPLVAAGYALSIGAGSYVATREVLRRMPETSRVPRHAAVAAGVLAYLAGSYAVIRVASGPLLP